MLPNKELSSASELAQRQFRKFNYLSQMIVRRRCSECGTSNFCADENKLSLLIGKVVLGSEDSDRYACPAFVFYGFVAHTENLWIDIGDR